MIVHMQKIKHKYNVTNKESNKTFISLLRHIWFLFDFSDIQVSVIIISETSGANIN